MKVSELDLNQICDYCRIIEEDLTDTEKATINTMQTAAVKYAADYTGLTIAELDEHEDITIAVLALIADMYDNRQRYADKSNLNRTVETILEMHRLNWLPKE